MNWIQDESGFTIQELLVVLIVGSLLVSMSLTTFLFANKVAKSWQDRTELKEAVHRTLQQIVFDVQRSNGILMANDSILVLTDKLKQISYRHDGHSIWRNGVLMDSGNECSLTVQSVGNPASGISFIRSTITAKSKLIHYTAEALAAPSRSSRSDFLVSQ